MSSLLTTPNVLILASILAVIGFFLGRSRALTAVDGDQRALHSRPKQHGWHVALGDLCAGLRLFWCFGRFCRACLRISTPRRSSPMMSPRCSCPRRSALGMTDREIEIREDVRLGLLINNVKALAVAIDGYIEGGSASEDEVAGWNADFAPLQERLQADGQYVASQVTRGHAALCAGPAQLPQHHGLGRTAGRADHGHCRVCPVLPAGRAGFPGPDLGRRLEHGVPDLRLDHGHPDDHRHPGRADLPKPDLLFGIRLLQFPLRPGMGACGRCRRGAGGRQWRIRKRAWLSCR